MLGQSYVCSPLWWRKQLLGGSLWNPVYVWERPHEPLAVPLVCMIFSEICLRLCYLCQFCPCGCSFQWEAQEASHVVGRAAFPGSGRGCQPFPWWPIPSWRYLVETCSGYELSYLKGLPSAWETVELNNSDSKAVEKSEPVLQEIHLDAAVILIAIERRVAVWKLVCKSKS